MTWYRAKVAQTVTQYVKQQNLQSLRAQVAQHPAVANLMHSLERPISDFSPGKQGTLLLGQNSRYRIPVQIVQYNSELPGAIKGQEGMTIQMVRTDGKDWSEIHHMWPVFADRPKNRVLELMKERARIVDESEGQKVLNWLTYIVATSREDPNTLLDELFYEGHDFIWQLLRSGSANFNSPAFTLAAFRQKQQEDRLKKQQEEQLGKKYRGGEGPQGTVALQFPNGWKWVDLQCGFSREEGDAGYHCGNVNAKPGDNILSLRDSENRVHVTLVNRNGVTNEIKAPGNKKPKPYTHPYIVALLKSGLVKDMEEATYLSQENFQLGDISPELLEDLKKSGFAPAANQQSNPVAAPTFWDRAFEVAKGNQVTFNRLLRKRFGDVPNVEYDKENRSLIVKQGFPLANLEEQFKVPPDSLDEIREYWWRRGIADAGQWAEQNENSRVTTYIKRYIKPYLQKLNLLNNPLSTQVQYVSQADKNLDWGLRKLWLEANLDKFVRNQNAYFKEHAMDENGFYPQIYIKDEGTFVGRKIYGKWQIATSKLQNPELLKAHPQPYLDGMDFYAGNVGNPSEQDMENALNVVDFANRRKFTAEGKDWLGTTQKPRQQIL
jgi:hypothetical protein